MSDVAVIAVGMAFTFASAGVTLALSSNRCDNRVVPVTPGKPQIERGLRTACRLIERFYMEQELPIRIVSADRGYQTATITANVPARISTVKVLRTKQDLEHYLLAHNISIVPNSLKLQISGTMTISWGKRADKEAFLSKVYRLHYASKNGAVTSGVFPIGLDMKGVPFCINLNMDESPHAMIVGSTGSGKTVAAMAIVIGALHAGWDVYILNPKIRPQEKRLGLWDFEDFKGVTYISRYPDMVTAMTRLSHSMDRCERPMLIMADELAEIIESMRTDIATPLGKISQKGREYNVHLVGITPKTTKSVLMDDMLHANSSTVIIGLRTNTKYLSMYGTGVGNMNLDTLSGNGHAMVRCGSATTEIQIALPDNIETVRDAGGVTHETHVGLLAITERWIEGVAVRGKVSKDGLRKFASAHGNGIGYDKVVEQYALLESAGRIKSGSEYQAGVKLQ